MAYSEAQEFTSAKPLPLTDRQARWVMAAYVIGCLFLPMVGCTVQITRGMSTNTQAPLAQVR